jgi:glycine cleavage system regulatory protein
MISNFITTIHGPDSPGIIRSLAQVTRSQGGEWLTSKVIKLDGQLAAIMSVVIKEEQETSLKSTLSEEFPDLHFVFSSASLAPQKTNKIINLVVDCIDRPGLTGDLSNILANLDICVENMECKRFAMDGINDTVFSAKLALAVPEGAESEMVAGEIEALSEDVRVNVS